MRGLLREPCSRPGHREEGQSLLEMTFGVVFLLGILLILFEMTMLFRTYIALLNAAREGAVYASAHAEIAALDVDQESPVYQSFLLLTRQEALAAGMNTDPEFFQVPQPEAPDGLDPLCPIRVTLRYKLVNPTEGIILPLVERMGLWRNTWITVVSEMPIR